MFNLKMRSVPKPFLIKIGQVLSLSSPSLIQRHKSTGKKKLQAENLEQPSKIKLS